MAISHVTPLELGILSLPQSQQSPTHIYSLFFDQNVSLLHLSALKTIFQSNDHSHKFTRSSGIDIHHPCLIPGTIAKTKQFLLAYLYYQHLLCRCYFPSRMDSQLRRRLFSVCVSVRVRFRDRVRIWDGKQCTGNFYLILHPCRQKITLSSILL